ncbi:rhodanese-related sulfurtransferase [Oscillatoria amoena NRMC-F 0135]|nr:rhodanese-related sulfurtransferase [Oscillatoria laete-virens]MDL5049136.1 rhodanese-related sulfurtransferase [Oscillatoria amoena NRMC-F 0135]MDL5052197.1 rhodanese-related sulfurtransferase [Oscillatoria laete-virens NRMC-F 0139]
MSEYFIAAFYKFADVPDPVGRQLALKEFCKARGIVGKVLVAGEGINGTIAGTESDVRAALDHAMTTLDFGPIEFKTSSSPFKPFHKLKIQVKNEIVTMRCPEANPAKIVGQYLDSQEWNQLLADPEVVVIDTRNSYEYELGTFEGAIDPKTRAFSQFPEFVEKNLDPAKHKKVAMFCTGGIRCEKASSYMLGQGFQEVYHLKGGILKYLEDTPPEQSRWKGECFVFDKRASVKDGLAIGSYVGKIWV